jgi:Lrp/AsnC family leucine-responsive transcriptional regulator
MVDSSSITPIDATDRQILRLLQDNGRLTIAALSDAVGLTPTPLRQRIEKLEQAGVIRGYGARLDPAKLGRATLAFVHVTLKEHSLEVHQAFVAAIVTLPEVIEVHHLAGEEDFLLKVMVRDIAAFEAFLLGRLTSGTPGIGRVKSTFVLSSAKTGAPVPIDDDAAEEVRR